MTEKLRIEDLTLGQIKELKKDISRQINNYLSDIVNLLNKDFDLGDIEIYVYTDVNEDTVNRITYRTSVKFSRENDD